jgi:hypothetical protein
MRCASALVCLYEDARTLGAYIYITHTTTPELTRPRSRGSRWAGTATRGLSAVCAIRAHRVCTVAVHCADSRLQPIARARCVVVRCGEGLEDLLGLGLAPEGQVRPLPPVGVELAHS